VAQGYANPELDLVGGGRAFASRSCRGLLCKLTGAEAAAVVAAAVLLAVSALAMPAREVIVARGQLIEIGGGFRMPEIGAILRAHPPNEAARPGLGCIARRRPPGCAVR
jgi:L-seryl-tRNA(Ser) seleniumtransferase